MHPERLGSRCQKITTTEGNVWMDQIRFGVHFCHMTYSSSKMPSQMPTQEKLVPQGNPKKEANFDVQADVHYCAPTASCWSEPR